MTTAIHPISLKQIKCFYQYSPKILVLLPELNLSRIFSEFARTSIKVNLMQNSALSFSVCFDHDKKTPQPLLEELGKIYHLKYNTPVDLITIRPLRQANLDELLENKEILLEQKSRTTLQWVVKQNSATNV
jgi:aspartate kinase